MNQIAQNSKDLFDLLTQLPAEVQQEFESITHPRCLKPGEVLFYQGDGARQIYMLDSGCIRLIQNTIDGKTVCVNLFSAGEIFGIASLLDSFEFPASAVAAAESHVKIVRGDDFRRFLRTHPHMYEKIIQILVKNLHSAHAQLRQTITECVEQRIGRCLLRLMTRFGVNNDQGILIDLPLSRQDIAEIVGTRLETVSRILKVWESEELVICGRQKVVLLNVPRIQEIVDGNLIYIKD